MIVGISMLFVFMFPPYVLAVESCKACGMQLSRGDKALCLIPVYNVIKAHCAFWGTAKVAIAAFVVSALCLCVRAVAIFFFYTNENFLVLSSAVAIIGLLIAWLTTGIVALRIASSTRQGMLVRLLCVCVPPLGTYLVAKSVGPFMKVMKDELDGTFEQAT